MTNKCQRFPLNPRKIVGCFAAGDNIDPCYKHFCLPFARSVESKLFQFWTQLDGMETLSRVKINFLFSKKQIFEFWKTCFSSFRPFVDIFQMIQNPLEYFCPNKLWMSKSSLKEITIEKKVVKFNYRFINWEIENYEISCKHFQAMRTRNKSRLKNENVKVT